MPQITVATINLRNRADRWRERRHLLIAQLLDVTPNLISLQEISFPITQGRWIRNQINARLPEGQRPYRLIQLRKQHPVYGYLEGIGVLTNLPILYSDSLNLGYGGRVALRVNVELSNRQPLDFVATHFHHVAEDKEARQEQAMMLTGWLADSRPIPAQVVAGDFNETPDGPAIQIMKQRFRSGYQLRHHFEPVATFPTALVPPGEWAGCLDYIFVSSGIRQVPQAQIFCDEPAPDDDTLYPSDHVGLLVTLEI